ncbi:hypothetical protein [Leptolyngbya sp. AN10]|uniref:hypothetical protein n=1 Tax=Leptolyngbya sp. AN10 TaxID=3423365 RepID=UPI003D313232
MLKTSATAEPVLLNFERQMNTIEQRILASVVLEEFEKASTPDSDYSDDPDTIENGFIKTRTHRYSARYYYSGDTQTIEITKAKKTDNWNTTAILVQVDSIYTDKVECKIDEESLIKLLELMPQLKQDRAQQVHYENLASLVETTAKLFEAYSKKHHIDTIDCYSKREKVHLEDYDYYRPTEYDGDYIRTTITKTNPDGECIEILSFSQDQCYKGYSDWSLDETEVETLISALLQFEQEAQKEEQRFARTLLEWLAPLPQNEAGVTIAQVESFTLWKNQQFLRIYQAHPYNKYANTQTHQLLFSMDLTNSTCPVHLAHDQKEQLLNQMQQFQFEIMISQWTEKLNQATTEGWQKTLCNWFGVPIQVTPRSLPRFIGRETKGDSWCTREIVFDQAVSYDSVESYAESQHWWGYHPQGYSCGISQGDLHGFIWVSHRYHYCA